MFSRSGVYCIFTVHFSSDWPHFKCWLSHLYACWLLHWTAYTGLQFQRNKKVIKLKVSVQQLKYLWGMLTTIIVSYKTFFYGRLHLPLNIKVWWILNCDFFFFTFIELYFAFIHLNFNVCGCDCTFLLMKALYLIIYQVNLIRNKQTLN